MAIEFDSKGNVKLGRLTNGSGFLGPEYYGCANTARRPVICRFGGKYIVGVEYDVSTLRIRSIGSNKRIIREGQSIIWAFKSRGPAVAKFTELCREVMKFNKETREAHLRDREAAQRGDLEAALRLGDY